MESKDVSKDKCADFSNFSLNKKILTILVATLILDIVWIIFVMYVWTDYDVLKYGLVWKALSNLHIIGKWTTLITIIIKVKKIVNKDLLYIYSL